MFHVSHSLRRSLWLFCLTAALLCTPALAAAREIDYDEVYHFQCEDFATDDASAAPRGILLTAVPGEDTGALYLGARRLQAGDAVVSSAFDQLRFEPSCAGEVTAELTWLPVFSGALSQETSLLIDISNGVNVPPSAESSTLTTYRNIPIDGQLRYHDPDDDEMSFSLQVEPKRGSVSLNRDGSYVYTPAKNKVGKDSFTVLITDSAGNTAEATVKVTIEKPTDQSTFADMADDGDQYLAMWLREQGVYAGQTLSGTLLFQPEQTVSRGEFLVMAMDLLDIEPTDQILSTGFADEADTPAWMRPYLVTALRAGFISGVQSPEGLCFRPEASITQAEAAVMLNNLLGLDSNAVVSVFAAEDVPARAADAVSCLSAQGITGLDQLSQPLTMRQTARLFYQVHQLWTSDQLSASLLAWAADA